MAWKVKDEGDLPANVRAALERQAAAEPAEGEVPQPAARAQAGGFGWGFKAGLVGFVALALTWTVGGRLWEALPW